MGKEENSKVEVRPNVIIVPSAILTYSSSKGLDISNVIKTHTLI